MKKYLLLAAVVCGMFAQTAKADEDSWKRNKGITIGFLTHQGLTQQEFSMQDALNGVTPHYDSKFGFSFTVSNSYLWPRSEGWAGDRIKVGVDARWFDIQFVKYKENPMDIYYADDEELNLDPMQLNLAVGFGPIVSVVPFPDADNGLRYLRANVYGHFMPGASALIRKDYTYDDDDNSYSSETKFSWAFVPTWDLGINFQWKNFLIGFEGRWSSAKYKNIGEEDIVDEFAGDYSDYLNEWGLGKKSGDDKTKFKNASFRINLGFRF